MRRSAARGWRACDGVGVQRLVTGCCCCLLLLCWGLEGAGLSVSMPANELPSVSAKVIAYVGRCLSSGSCRGGCGDADVYFR